MTQLSPMIASSQMYELRMWTFWPTRTFRPRVALAIRTCSSIFVPAPKMTFGPSYDSRASIRRRLSCTPQGHGARAQTRERGFTWTDLRVLTFSSLNTPLPYSLKFVVPWILLSGTRGYLGTDCVLANRNRGELSQWPRIQVNTYLQRQTTPDHHHGTNRVLSKSHSRPAAQHVPADGVIRAEILDPGGVRILDDVC